MLRPNCQKHICGPSNWGISICEFLFAQIGILQIFYLPKHYATPNLTSRGKNAGLSSPTVGTRVIKVEQRVVGTWGRCYDHNFLRILPFFGKKLAQKLAVV
jgi:hypothetical protein